MHSRRRLRALVAMLLVMIGVSSAQLQPRPDQDSTIAEPEKWIRIEGGLVIDENAVHTARETASHSRETPTWKNAPGFKDDVFTFARVIFQSDSNARGDGSFGRHLGWWVDYPDADLNFSWRLQQLTSIRTDPDGRVLKLTDPSLTDYPLIYMEHTGYMRLSDEETDKLRKYLTNGGALFVNDFWGAREWEGFAREIDRVLPGRSWTELTMDHPVFHCVYDLQGPMHRLQVPTIQFWNRSVDRSDPTAPLQRIYRGEGSEEMHVRAMFDDQQHMMIIAILNSDVSDGWERESENEVYFNTFSEKIAYPLGINIIVYLMTH